MIAEVGKAPPREDLRPLLTSEAHAALAFFDRTTGSNLGMGIDAHGFRSGLEKV